MADVVPLLFADVGAKLCTVLMATDAMGANAGFGGSSVDHGGFGIVAADISPATAEDCYRLGTRPAHTVLSLDGQFNGSKFPHKSIARNVPCTRLPASVFSSDVQWHDVDWGRWKWADHVTLGESRAVVRLARGLAASTGTCRTKVLSLQDNMPCTCAMTKGRSAKASLNYLIRQRSASILGGQLSLLLPWVQSKLQTADALSRRIDRPEEA